MHQLDMLKGLLAVIPCAPVHTTEVTLEKGWHADYHRLLQSLYMLDVLREMVQDSALHDPSHSRNRNVLFGACSADAGPESLRQCVSR